VDRDDRGGINERRRGKAYTTFRAAVEAIIKYLARIDARLRACI